MMDDNELLRRYAETRSEEAFAELVRRRIGLVYSVALRHTNDAHRAEDVTQAVFTALARKAEALAERPVLVGWLYRSAQFAASDAVRVEVRRTAREQEAHTMHEIERDSPEPDWNNLRPVLDEVLNGMDEGDRDVVLLRFFDGLRFAEIGEKLKLSEGAARMRVERALARMHGALARRGVKSTAAALGLALAGQAGVAAPAGLAATVTGAAMVSAASTGVGAGAGALVFMGMTKTMAGLLGVALVAGLSVGWVGTGKAREAQAGLAAQVKQQEAMSAKLRDLEGAVQAAEQRMRGVETENAKLLAEAKKVQDSSPAQLAAETPAITAGMVTARLKKARELVKDGNEAEALAECLWCFDIGLRAVANMGPVKNSSLPRMLAELGKRYPPALDALREHGDQARARALASESDNDAAQEFGAINHALGKDQANLEFYNQLPEGDRRRSAVVLQSYEYLIETQHYKEAAIGLPYNLATSSFERSKEDVQYRESTIKRTAKSIEMLAGAGDLEHARTLAQRLLAWDNSETTKALVQKGVERAGQPGLLTGPAKP